MGKPRNTRKYPTYPEIPEIPGNTRKKKRYPEIPDRIFRHSYPTRTRPATRYFVQYPTRPDPILKNPTRWAPSIIRCRIEVVSLLLLVLLCLKSMLEISSGYICDCNLWPATFPSHISPPSDCLTWLEVSWLRQFPSSCSFVALRYNDDAKSQIFS